MDRPLMLDLFAGTGGSSSAFRDAGWEVVTVDADPQHGTTIVADLSTWSWTGRRPTLVWASPPCTEFSRESMPWCRTGESPDLGLYNAALRIVAECKPEWWVIENVRGAQRWLGRAVMHAGPFYLWGWFPHFDPPRIEPFKESLSSSDKVGRAAVPYSLSLALLNAITGKKADTSMPLFAEGA